LLEYIKFTLKPRHKSFGALTGTLIWFEHKLGSILTRHTFRNWTRKNTSATRLEFLVHKKDSQPARAH